MRSLFGCTQFHRADLQTAQQRNLYVPPAGGGMFFRPAVNFMPSVGLYFVQQPPRPGSESFRLYKLPATAPVAPFQLRAVSTSCTAEMHAVAQTALSQLQAHFAQNASTGTWTITPHSAPSGMWYALEPTDISTIPALLNCARVASASKDDLTKLGWDGVMPPSLNYTPKLGLYLLMTQRRFNQAVPGEKPAPAPSATP